MSSRVFLLSPAYCGGRRATYLLREGSDLALARRLRDGTLTLGEAFAFMSGLYFRGKLAYALHFADAGAPLRHDSRSRRTPRGPVQIITPTRGLRPPESLVSPGLLREFAAVDVTPDDRRYRAPLDRDLARLAGHLPPGARVVLLGSLATGKYVDALTEAFGERLHYPTSFIGRGDMSRGGLLLRAVDAGEELAYAPLTREVNRHGPRPPRLAPRPPGSSLTSFRMATAPGFRGR